MHDDPSYYAFVPSFQPQETNPAPASKSHRRGSLLAQPHEGPLTNSNFTGGQSEEFRTATELPKSPPKATLIRRAQSYSDFHYAVKAVVEAGHKVENKRRSTSHDYNKQKNGIWNSLDFADWYEGFEDNLLEASHNEYISYLDQLKSCEAYLDTVSSSTNSTLDILLVLSQSFKSVGTQTTAFQKQCEDLVEEQKRLETIADDIDTNLQYYGYLEPITRRLNAPGAGNFVRSKEFSDMLARLDECLEYMNTHLSQREAPTYRSRYRLLLTRGLTLIRVNFMTALRDIASDVTKRIADKQLNDTTMSALLYAKFRVGASELKAVAQEIRQRAIVAPGSEPGAEAEYQSLMNELYVGYSATRGRLILPLIAKKMAEIEMAPSSAKDLVSFARSSIGYIRGICDDEYGLWREWFEGEEGLYDFLESVCEPLYDYLRPRIIHENQLLKLCELCSFLQTRYFKDIDEEVDDPIPQQLEFSTLIQPALEDAQTRLVFRTQAILRDEIENFKPKPADLDYPARNKPVALFGTKTNGPATSGRRELLNAPSLIDSQAAEEDGVLGGNYGFDIELSYQGWYPTLRKAIWLLSRIYRLVNSTVFDDLAHLIVHQTTYSLQRASAMLSVSASPMDARLFLLKHLLILKQQIVAFDIEYITPEVNFDFSGMASTFQELRERGGLFDPRALWRLLSGSGGSLLPRVVENMLDAKAELDGRLRTVINDFCSASANRITTVIAKPAVEKKSFDPTAVVPAIQAAANVEVPLLRSKLDDYLDDGRTKETLVSAIQDQVVLNYEGWYEQWSATQRANGRGVLVSSKGKGRENDVWDSGVFTEWALAVFGVGRVYGESKRLSGGSDSDSSGDSRSISSS